MKTFVLLALLFTLSLSGCGKGRTTNTVSSQFNTLAEKQAFLERYVQFRRSYDDLHFYISFNDGGSGMVPGPTEWNICILAVVSAKELDQWIAGLSETTNPDTTWTTYIPGAPADLKGFKWYVDDRRTVGVDRANRIVLYQNYAS